MTASTNQPVTWWDWAILVLLGVASLAIGSIAARLVGFPYYPGNQGVLVQQPLSLALVSLLAMVVAAAISSAIALLLLRRMDARLGVAIGLISLAGFSLRGGTMGSVMLASDGREVFWWLSLEMVVLSLLVAGGYALRKHVGLAAETWGGTASDYGVAIVQLVVFLLAMLILGQSSAKGQGLGAVLVAGVLSSVVTRLILGRVWAAGWSVPLVAGALGYLLNAVSASNVEIGVIAGPASGLGIALPLDYVALGPVGVLLGEVFYGHRNPEVALEA